MAELPDVVSRPGRLTALAALEANAESSAQALDRIAATACRMLGAPIALVNLVGADRQRFVGASGGDPSMREMPLTHGFCPFALGAEEGFAFADARADPVLAANPVVEQGVVAYAGVPLRAANGEPVGTLCAIDHEAHLWTDDDLALLAELAAGAAAELQLLAAARQSARHQARVRALATLSSALAPADSARDVLDQLVPMVDRMDASALWLLMPDDSRQALETAAVAGADPAVVDREARVPLDAEVPVARVARSGQGDYLATRADVRDGFAPVRATAPDAGSVALLPLTDGVLGVCFTDEQALSPEDREYLTALAGISGLALAR